MNSILHISSPYSESWVYWVLLLLITLVFINNSLNTSVAIVFRNIFSHSDRVYGGQNSNIFGILSSWIFRIAVIALAIYIAIFEKGIFSFVTYLMIFGIVGIVCLVQQMLVWGVGWVFLTRKQLDNGLSQLEIVRNSVGILLLPMLLVMIWVNSQLCTWIILGIIGVLFVILTLTKSLQLYYKNILSILYILLYLTCLEIIPAGWIVLWTQNILR